MFCRVWSLRQELICIWLNEAQDVMEKHMDNQENQTHQIVMSTRGIDPTILA